MSKTLERRAKLRESLILAGERRIAAGGLAGLKTRDLARDIGCKMQTIRYYEEIGLMPEPARTACNQRRYGQRH